MLFQKQFTIALISLFSLFVVTNTTAQTSVAIGGKMGPSFSSLVGADAGNPNRRAGFTGGLFITISPLKFLSVQPEVLFSQRGATNFNEYWNARQEFRLNYLEFPILVKLRVPIKHVVYPHIYAGPIFSKNLASKYKLQQMNTNVDLSGNFEVRNFDFGGVFGFGIDVEVSRLFVTADLRYGISALNLDNSDQHMDLKNTEIMALLGVGILLNK